MKRSSRKKQLHKWTKLGVGLAAVTVLGGLVEPVDVPLLSNCTVEAQELTNQSGGEQALPADTATVTIELETTGVEELVGASYRYQRIRGFERLEIHLQPGETYTLPTYDGYKLINFKNLNEVTDIAPEDAVLSYADFTPGQRVRLYYDYLMTDQVYDVVTKQYVDRETVIPSTTPSINSPTDTPPAQPIETPAETPTEKPAEQLVEKPTEQPVEKLVERPTASPTGQSASEKQATKQGDKEPAAPASQSKQSTVKPASTSQSQTKTLPATGEVSSVLHLTGLGLLGLAGLVVKRRQRKSS
ncbi:LPXTG cell wall anchor domain-containing protein [Streptococcus suis]